MNIKLIIFSSILLCTGHLAANSTLHTFSKLLTEPTVSTPAPAIPVSFQKPSIIPYFATASSLWKMSAMTAFVTPLIGYSLLWWFHHNNITAVRSAKTCDRIYENPYADRKYTVSTQGSTELDTKAISCLGFNPAITIHKQNNVPSEERSILVSGYGWGPVSQRYYLPALENWATYSGALSLADLCFFDFPDSSTAHYSTLVNWHRIRSINFGTDYDFKTMLFVFKTCVEKEYSAIHGLYHSRAGASFLRALYAVHHPKEFEDTFNKLDINSEKIEKIKKALQKGQTVLAQPWFDVNATLKLQAEIFDIPLGPFSQFLWKKILCGEALVNWFIGFTAFKKEAQSGINILQTIATEIKEALDKNLSNPYPVLTITVAEDDSVIGNSHMEALNKMASSKLIAISKIENDTKTNKTDKDTRENLAESLKKPTDQITVITHKSSCNHNEYHLGATILQKKIGQ